MASAAPAAAAAVRGQSHSDGQPPVGQWAHMALLARGLQVKALEPVA